MDTEPLEEMEEGRGEYQGMDIIFLEGITSLACPNCTAIRSSGCYIVVRVYEMTIEPFMAGEITCCNKKIYGPMLFESWDDAKDFVDSTYESMTDREIALLEFESLESEGFTIQ